MTARFSAMIFAAGFGTRMGSLTRDLPKPMVPMNGRPMIDFSIKLLRDAGITRIVANAHYLPHRIIPHLENLGVTVSHEEEGILDTGGGLKAALPLLGKGPVITINPDALWMGENPVLALMGAWRDDMNGLLMLVENANVLGGFEKGDFSLEHGEIRRNGPYLFGGAQIIQTEKLRTLEGAAFSLNRYWDVLAKQCALHGLVYSGNWCDLGTAEGLARGEQGLRNV